jgi:hypothetical protein
MFATTYVRDIGAARAFYELPGFHQLLDGRADSSAWSVMQHGELSVLMAYTRPRLAVPPLPLPFYLYFDDLEVVTGRLDAASVPVTCTGHDHLPCPRRSSPAKANTASPNSWPGASNPRASAGLAAADAAEAGPP